MNAAGSEVLVVTANDTNSGKPSLFRCALDLTTCSHTDISAGQGAGSGGSPSALIDTIDDKLLVVVNNGSTTPPQKLGLIRCELDGSACTYTDISAGQGGMSGASAKAIVDITHRKLLVATSNGANDNKPGLFRCSLDGSACTHTDISAAQPGATVSTFPMLAAAPDGAVHVVIGNYAGPLSLFSICSR